MKKQIWLAGTILLMAASAFTFIHVRRWKIVEVYTVKFDTGIHSGEFRGLKGTISFDEDNLEVSKFDVTIDPATINTGNGMKNKEAKGPNWLDVEKYPLISFTSTLIARSGQDYEARGTLDLRGVKKEIVIPFKFSNSTFTSTFSIDRRDYSLYDWTHEKGSSLMEVSLSVPVVNP
jgi:polyisoprenoid-binding protein YceI